MSGRIQRTAQALRDYRDIWNYIAADNPAAADKLLRRFEEVLKVLAASPRIGKARPEIGPTVRSRPIGNYLLFYEPADDGILLLRVLHGARDLKRAYRAKPLRRNDESPDSR